MVAMFMSLLSIQVDHGKILIKMCYVTKQNISQNTIAYHNTNAHVSFQIIKLIDKKNKCFFSFLSVRDNKTKDTDFIAQNEKRI